MPSFNAVIFASKAWLALLWGGCLLALSAIWLSAMPVALSLVSTIVCLGYSLLSTYRYWTGRVVWLAWSSIDEVWQFRERTGRRAQGHLVLHASFVSRLCLIIALRCSGRRRLYFIPVFYDAVPSMVYRRLKVLLRAYPHSEEGSAPLL